MNLWLQAISNTALPHPCLSFALSVLGSEAFANRIGGRYLGWGTAVAFSCGVVLPSV